MNYLVQRGKVRSQVISVPDGLPEILADITREVLRCQPTTECLCQFIVDYLHSVIVAREKAEASRQIIEKALKMVENIIDDICLCSMEHKQAIKMSLAMEDCFRRFLEQRRCEERSGKEIIRFHEKDMLDEIRERCQFTEQEMKTNRPEITEAYRRFVNAYVVASEEVEGTEVLYQYFKERESKRQDELKRNSAATCIQSNFRGYMVRRRLNSSVGSRGRTCKASTIETEILYNIDLGDPVLNRAASKIQSFFRQHLSTVSMKQQSILEERPMEGEAKEAESVGAVKEAESVGAAGESQAEAGTITEQPSVREVLQEVVSMKSELGAGVVDAPPQDEEPVGEPTGLLAVEQADEVEMATGEVAAEAAPSAAQLVEQQPSVAAAAEEPPQPEAEAPAGATEEPPPAAPAAEEAPAAAEPAPAEEAPAAE